MVTLAAIHGANLINEQETLLPYAMIKRSLWEYKYLTAILGFTARVVIGQSEEKCIDMLIGVYIVGLLGNRFSLRCRCGCENEKNFHPHDAFHRAQSILLKILESLL